MKKLKNIEKIIKGKDGKSLAVFFIEYSGDTLHPLYLKRVERVSPIVGSYCRKCGKIIDWFSDGCCPSEKLYSKEESLSFLHKIK